MTENRDPEPGAEQDTSNDPKLAAEALSAYLDDELETEDRAEVERLLSDSPDMRADAAGLRLLMDAMGNLPDVQAPPDFHEKLDRKLRRRQLLQENLWQSLASLPFQVISIIIMIAIAAGYMMVQLDLERSRLERDPTVHSTDEDANEPHSDSP